MALQVGRGSLARTGADRHQVGQARWKFLTWCADSDIPEVRQLATTVDRWWPEIAAFIGTGHSNAKSEEINRVIKLVARNAFGFRNADNQRLRTRCAPPAEPADTSAPLNFEDPEYLLDALLLEDLRCHNVVVSVQAALTSHLIWRVGGSR